MTDNKYNGWSSFETWQAGLWLNESDFLGMLQEDGCKHIDAEYVENFIWDMLSQHEPSGLMRDIVNAWISCVNFVELADHFNLDLEG